MVIIMIIAKQNDFESLQSYIPQIWDRIVKLPSEQQRRIQEIRIRLNRFVTLELGGPCDRISLDLKISSTELGEFVKRFCEYSVHSYMNQFLGGYITISGGHRVGICGRAVISEGVIQSIREISSINIRIAREYIGCSDKLFELVSVNSRVLKGLLIIGRPMSAKTTMMRDLTRNLSMSSKVCVIDERGELAAVSEGVPSFDVGQNTDVFSDFPKKHGFITALRAMSPEYIVCDEIGYDAADLSSCVNSGVKLMLTAHCSGFDELSSSILMKELMLTGGISHVALLGDGQDIGRLMDFRNVEIKGDRIEYISSFGCGIDRSRYRDT